jgi:hypothetical protein
MAKPAKFRLFEASKQHLRLQYACWPRRSLAVRRRNPDWRACDLEHGAHTGIPLLQGSRVQLLVSTILLLPLEVVCSSRFVEGISPQSHSRSFCARIAANATMLEKRHAYMHIIIALYCGSFRRQPPRGISLEIFVF